LHPVVERAQPTDISRARSGAACRPSLRPMGRRSLPLARCAWVDVSFKSN
jgi:hypothetical protein